MGKDTVTAAYLLRMTGLFGIAVGVAWAVQTLGFSDATETGRLLWIVAAAGIAGAGAGLVIAARGVPDASEKKGALHTRLEPVFE